MYVAYTVRELQQKHRELKQEGFSTGFVPTMGALHPGHLSLVEASKQACNLTLVSIFVNPTQFNNPDDFAKYPVSIAKDLEMLEESGVDIVFVPHVEEVYPEKDERVFDFGGLDQVMEGKFRPGHFNGVAQVVSKLFDFTQPDFAFFGEKDFQQLAIIQFMTKQLNYPVTIVPIPTMREADGLAMSSRNQRLSAEQRTKARLISKVLFESKEMRRKGLDLSDILKWAKNQFQSETAFELEYIEIVDSQSLQSMDDFCVNKEPVMCIAAFLGQVRLIDNMRL